MATSPRPDTAARDLSTRKHENDGMRGLGACRHCPMITVSPSLTRKHGDTCAGMLPCRFSYLHPGSRLSVHLHFPADVA